MTKAERAEMYRVFLLEEGYAPKIDADGDVQFKFEGGSYYIEVAEKDETYFRVVFPNFWEIETEEERARAVKAAMESTAQTKVAKVYVVKDNTSAAIEMFCSPPDAFKPVFRRSLSAVQAASQTFREKMRNP